MLRASFTRVFHNRRNDGELNEMIDTRNCFKYVCVRVFVRSCGFFVHVSMRSSSHLYINDYRGYILFILLSRDVFYIFTILH